MATTAAASTVAHITTPLPQPTIPSLLLLTSRALPTGSCSPSCACQSFWSASSASPFICACGHHACYHSPTPPPSYPLPATPTSSTSSSVKCTTSPTTSPVHPPINCPSAYSNLDLRLQTVESLAATSQALEAKLRKSKNRIDLLESRINELLERVQEWEDFGIELEDQLVDWEEDMSQRMRMLEVAVAAVAAQTGSLKGTLVTEGLKVVIHAVKKEPMTETLSPPPVYQQLPMGFSSGNWAARGRKRASEEDQSGTAETKRGRKK